jgi:hypothetical protein
MLKVLREITEDWDVNYRLPNHTYLMNGDKVVAYKPWHEDPIQHLKSSSRLDKRYRKFQELPYIESEWDSVHPAATHTKKTIQIVGSKGNIYEVDPEEGTCTCPGFQFRGSCKHLGLTRVQNDATIAA